MPPLSVQAVIHCFSHFAIAKAFPAGNIFPGKAGSDHNFSRADEETLVGFASQAALVTVDAGGYRIEPLTRSRKEMQASLPTPGRRMGKGWRKLVETGASRLTERYRIAKEPARDLRQDQNRPRRKALSHAVGVFINLQPGRPPGGWRALLASRPP